MTGITPEDRSDCDRYARSRNGSRSLPTRLRGLMNSANKPAYVTVEGIDHSDAPDYCDAYISEGEWPDGTPLTEREIDVLNQDSQYVYDMVLDSLQ